MAEPFRLLHEFSHGPGAKQWLSCKSKKLHYWVISKINQEIYYFCTLGSSSESRKPPRCSACYMSFSKIAKISGFPVYLISLGVSLLFSKSWPIIFRLLSVSVINFTFDQTLPRPGLNLTPFLTVSSSNYPFNFTKKLLLYFFLFFSLYFLTFFSLHWKQCRCGSFQGDGADWPSSRFF